MDPVDAKTVTTSRLSSLYNLNYLTRSATLLVRVTGGCRKFNTEVMLHDRTVTHSLLLVVGPGLPLATLRLVLGLSRFDASSRGSSSAGVTSRPVRATSCCRAHAILVVFFRLNGTTLLTLRSVTTGNETSSSLVAWSLVTPGVTMALGPTSLRVLGDLLNWPSGEVVPTLCKCFVGLLGVPYILL